MATPSRYDFVVVGGGSAGSVLANRLSADPSNRVLVLEAGRPDYRWDVFIHMPAALTFPIGSRFYDWQYRSEPEPRLHGRRVAHARGKVLGGSSSINGMIFQRGNPLDYQRWAAEPGMERWDHAHCLPYFKRLETCLAAAPDDPWRGHDGPLVLERGPASSPLFRAFFEAVQQAGYQLTDDVNGYRQEGFAPFDRNLHRGRRLSASRAYLHPVLGRPNLEVTTRALVTRVLFEGTRAVGVEYTRGKGPPLQARAGEVILCGGAINSPQTLQLSGVGPAPLLREHGIRARGVDVNGAMVDVCREQGLDVEEADALAYLRARPDESLGGLFAAQVIEHLEPRYLTALLDTAIQKLRPGGPIVLETINPACWFAFFESYIRDITHVRAIHPDTLKYLLVATGFQHVEIRYRAPYPERDKLQPIPPHATLGDSVETLNANVQRLNRLLFTWLDYAAIGRRP